MLQELVQRLHLGRTELHLVPPRDPSRARLGRRELLAGIGLQWIDPHAFRLAVRPVANRPAAHAAKALRRAELEPVRGPVAGAPIALRVNKRFRQ